MSTLLNVCDPRLPTCTELNMKKLRSHFFISSLNSSESLKLNGLGPATEAEVSLIEC